MEGDSLCIRSVYTNIPMSMIVKFGTFHHHHERKSKKIDSGYAHYTLKQFSDYCFTVFIINNIMLIKKESPRIGSYCIK